jgi:anti-anti-sigma regulatory factor
MVYGHVCSSYDDPATFASQARDFLVEGLAAGERVWYVAVGQPATIVERLSDVSGFQDSLRRGAAEVVSLSSTYSGGGIIDPAAQVSAYAAATDEALAAGYAGLRVVADATSLARTSAQLDAFARYEHLIDRYIRTRPMSALCAYDRLELGDRAVAQLACMHSENNAEGVLFRLYACDPGDGCAALAGELDMSNHELFATALDRADLRPVDGELVVQATHLRFIDHRALIHLRDYARRRGATAVLRTSRSAAARIVELLNLSGIRVETAR